MTEIATRTPTQELVRQVRGGDFLEQIRAAIPGNLPPERFVRSIVTAINQNPKLVAVDRRTFFNAAIRCAQDGLLPDGREAVIVDVGDKKVEGGQAAAYWPMIGGYRKIAADHGMTLNAFVVYENDEFDYVLGETPHIHHKPPKLGQDRGAPIGAYAVATWEDGRMVCPPEVMDLGEIEKVRAVSRAATNPYGPWVKWWDQQARKTAARRLFKQLPLRDLSESETRIVAAADDEADLPPADPEAMTVDEANVAAGIGVARAPQGDGPVDVEPEPEDAEWSEPTPVEPSEGEQASFFQEQAERAQAAARSQERNI